MTCKELGQLLWAAAFFVNRKVIMYETYRRSCNANNKFKKMRR